jgi:hypothetical protein
MKIILSRLLAASAAGWSASDRKLAIEGLLADEKQQQLDNDFYEIIMIANMK